MAMANWKRDIASGLVVVVPIVASFYVIVWLYGLVAGLTPEAIVSAEEISGTVPSNQAPLVAELLRVGLALLVFVMLVLAIGYLMRTAAGALFEAAVDDVANRVPGLRVVYNASKMATETALGGADELQEPVKITTWDGMRMTAFKTGKQAPDGRDVLFLPTAPNITTGFVVEMEPDEYAETDETVEEALTRILSAGFGDAEEMGPSVPVDSMADDDEE
jgi:uncharacterized membrane protein